MKYEMPATPCSTFTEFFYELGESDVADPVKALSDDDLNSPSAALIEEIATQVLITHPWIEWSEAEAEMKRISVGLAKRPHWQFLLFVPFEDPHCVLTFIPDWSKNNPEEIRVDTTIGRAGGRLEIGYSCEAWSATAARRKFEHALQSYKAGLREFSAEIMHYNIALPFQVRMAMLEEKARRSGMLSAD